MRLSSVKASSLEPGARNEPAQAMLADIELTGVVADDHGVGGKPCASTVPHSAASVASIRGAGSTLPSVSGSAFQAL
jgi:hypothetical protein